VFIYCEDIDGAKDIEDDLKDYAGDDEEVKNPTVQRKGKMVFIGSKGIWKELD